MSQWQVAHGGCFLIHLLFLSPPVVQCTRDSSLVGLCPGMLVVNPSVSLQDLEGRAVPPSDDDSLTGSVTVSAESASTHVYVAYRNLEQTLGIKKHY